MYVTLLLEELLFSRCREALVVDTFSSWQRRYQRGHV
jgi:hypothetical protein